MESTVYVHLYATFIWLNGRVTALRSCTVVLSICQFCTSGCLTSQFLISQGREFCKIYTLGRLGCHFLKNTLELRVRPNFLTPPSVFIESPSLGGNCKLVISLKMQSFKNELILLRRYTTVRDTSVRVVQKGTFVQLK